MSEADWSGWHDRYDDPESSVSRRLAAVQALLTRWLDETRATPVRILSMCAGDGRDVIEVLGARPDVARISAILIENDSKNVERARERIEALGLGQVAMVEGDAARVSAYAAAVPADLVIVAGVFGNIARRDIRAIVEALPEFCNEGATVIWTRRRKPLGVIEIIDGWFADAGFVSLPSPRNLPPTSGFVGAHRFVGAAKPLGPDRTLFSFVDRPWNGSNAEASIKN